MLIVSVQWEPNCSMRTDNTKLIVAFRNFASAPTYECWDRWDVQDSESCEIMQKFGRQPQKKEPTWHT
jgi:hypothetical protein